MKKTIAQMENEIRKELIGARYDNCVEIEDILTNIIGQKVEWFDTEIDDGVDDDETEDEYIMKTSFSTKDDRIIIRVYWGDVTEEITYVRVN